MLLTFVRMTTQTPWLERQWQFDLAPGMFPIIYSRLDGAAARLKTLFTNIAETDAEKKRDGWSAKEHLGHLYDLEELWWNRWEDFNNGIEVLTPADITNRRTTQANHNSKKIAQLLSSFNAERAKILKAIYSCDEHLLMRTSLHPRLKTPMTLVDYLYFVAEHDDHHMAAIMLLLNNNVNRS